MGESILGLGEKVVVITGGSQGVGRGCAVQFARAGSHIVVVARGKERAEDAAAEVRAMGREALAVEADVTVQEDIDRIVAESLARFGRIDVWVNNVGGRRGKPEGTLLDSGRDYWNGTLDLNVITTLACSQAAARAMIDAGHGGVILNVGSVAAYRATPNLAPYGSSKAAVDQITKTLALELAPHGIRVNGIAPGMVDTDSLREFFTDEDFVERAKHVPAGRIAGPDDLGKAAVMLASDLASWVYGRILIADGGELLQHGA